MLKWKHRHLVVYILHRICSTVQWNWLQNSMTVAKWFVQSETSTRQQLSQLTCRHNRLFFRFHWLHKIIDIELAFNWPANDLIIVRSVIFNYASQSIQGATRRLRASKEMNLHTKRLCFIVDVSFRPPQVRQHVAMVGVMYTWWNIVLISETRVTASSLNLISTLISRFVRSVPLHTKSFSDCLDSFAAQSNTIRNLGMLGWVTGWCGM